jgi:hypothetical protein
MWSVHGALAAAVVALTLAAGGSARAMDSDQEQELAQRLAAGAKPQLTRLNDVVIENYKRPPKDFNAHEFLVISKPGADPIRLAAQSFTMRNLQVGAGPGPNAIFVGYAGGAHCCYTVDLLWIAGEFRVQTIELFDSELKIDSAGGPPRLSFYDFNFAYWNASFADSPAPLVVLSYDHARREYAADLPAMRKPAPSADELVQQAAKLRKIYEQLRPDELNSDLWGAMLDLIYAGNAASARGLLDQAWPPGRPDKDAFLKDFTKQLWEGTTWRQFDLGRVLAASESFPPPAAAP